MDGNWKARIIKYGALMVSVVGTKMGLMARVMEDRSRRKDTRRMK